MTRRGSIVGPPFSYKSLQISITPGQIVKQLCATGTLLQESICILCSDLGSQKDHQKSLAISLMQLAEQFIDGTPQVMWKPFIPSYYPDSGSEI